MIPDDVVRLPAGWYPDPTGLPQLRWWDNHAWTQHTTAARQPLIVQEQPLAWADDLPTRRERREREREDVDTDDLTPPTDQSLLQLAPPSSGDEPADQPAPEPPTPRETPAGENAAASSSPSAPANADDTDDTVDDPSSYVPLSASGHAGRIPSVPSLGEADDEREPRRPHLPFLDAAPSTAGTPLFDQVAASVSGAAGAPSDPAARSRNTRQPGGTDAAKARVGRTPAGAPGFSAVPIGTAPVWIIALLPLLHLVIVLLLVTGLGSDQGTELLMPAILIVIYLATVALAFADHRLLRANGVMRPAHWAWSLLTAPVYLFARAVVLTRTTGRGFGPVLVWFTLALLSVASVLAVPGMLITSVPAAFSAQAEQSVTADAAANGATLDVSCPAAPPILVGQSFSCTGHAANGKSYEIQVSLQRINGWINWRVDDWGVNTLSR